MWIWLHVFKTRHTNCSKSMGYECFVFQHEFSFTKEKASVCRLDPITVETLPGPTAGRSGSRKREWGRQWWSHFFLFCNQEGLNNGSSSGGFPPLIIAWPTHEHTKSRDCENTHAEVHVKLQALRLVNEQWCCFWSQLRRRWAVSAGAPFKITSRLLLRDWNLASGRRQSAFFRTHKCSAGRQSFDPCKIWGHSLHLSSFAYAASVRHLCWLCCFHSDARE